MENMAREVNVEKKLTNISTSRHTLQRPHNKVLQELQRTHYFVINLVTYLPNPCGHLCQRSNVPSRVLSRPADKRLWRGLLILLRNHEGNKSIHQENQHSLRTNSLHRLKIKVFDIRLGRKSNDCCVHIFGYPGPRGFS